MPHHNNNPVLTIGKADECRRIINAWLTEAGNEPGRLYKPGHEGDFWCYSLEGGPEDWPLILSGSITDSPVTWPEGVWAEPVNTWCLALHPTT